jgi:uncharacterized protein (TIGR02246 family)
MNPDERAIRDLITQWHRATAAGDVDTVLGLMDENVVFLVAGRPPMRGRAALAKGLRALLARHRITSTGDVQEIEVEGNFAYCWTNLTVAVVPLAGGAGVTRSGAALSIFRRHPDGRWVLCRDANLLPPT